MTFTYGIFFFSIFINIGLSLSSTHAVIGNYSKLNPKDCGTTTFSSDLDESVFRLPGGYQPEMADALNSTKQEAPWTVKIVYEHSFVKSRGSWTFQRDFCTGSLFANYWILTAAHCLGDRLGKKDRIRIFIGSYTPITNKYFEGTEIHKHPEFIPKFQHDMGLIRLKHPVQTNETIQNICLPESGIFNKKREWAILAGWGSHNNTGYTNQDAPLQYGYFRFYPSDDYSSVRNHYLLNGKHSSTGPFGCVGDSGAPSWQFQNKRAVLIGVHSLVSMRNLTDKCGQIGLLFRSSRVSKYIDWIKKVTNLN